MQGVGAGPSVTSDGQDLENTKGLGLKYTTGRRGGGGRLNDYYCYDNGSVGKVLSRTADRQHMN